MMSEIPPALMDFPIDPTSPAALGAFALAWTQIAKDLGMQGNLLKLVSIVVGGLAALVSINYPDVWALLFSVSLGATTTGGASFLFTVLQKMKAVKEG
jgi:hypothetical protein